MCSSCLENSVVWECLDYSLGYLYMFNNGSVSELSEDRENVDVSIMEYLFFVSFTKLCQSAKSSVHFPAVSPRLIRLISYRNNYQKLNYDLSLSTQHTISSHVPSYTHIDRDHFSFQFNGFFNADDWH
ncbi:hypothetical protein Avbf_14154 [Armadillidium vulgare]|nr:hypothetical protein Avbf_14154 [Armadillidium vulgare]